MIDKLLDEAINEAKIGVMEKHGGPFGAVIADSQGNIISRGHNEVLVSHDPTMHAEVNAIRKACQKLKTTDLSQYVIYSSCEPCPMCLSAIIWANIKVMYFGATRKDADKIGFKDNIIYEFLAHKNQILKSNYISKIECSEMMEKYEGEIY